MTVPSRITTEAALDLFGISGNPNLRTFKAPDDRLKSKYRMGDIVVVDVTDLSLREGYILIGWGDVAQAYRMMPNFEGGYLLMCDDKHYKTITLTRDQIEAQILGRIVGAVCRV